MKVRCDRDDLLGAVLFASRAISNRATLPVLSGLRVEASEGDEVAVAATDLELTMETTLKAGVDEPGTVIIPGRLFGEMVRNLSPGQVSLAATEGEVEIGSGRGQFRVRALAGEDYPALPIDDRDGDGETLEIESRSLATALSQVIRAASSDETRQILVGVLFELDDGKVTLAATDSYRLAMRSLEAEGIGEQARKVVLPARALGELVKALQGADGAVRATVRENLIIFFVDALEEAAGTGEAVIGSRYIEGEFPNYRQLIPSGYQNSLKVDRDALLDVVKRVGLLAQNNMPVKLALGSELEVSAHTPDVGEGQEILDAEYEGEPIVIAFNPDFLIEGVSAIQTSKIVMEAGDGLKPAVLRGEDGDGFTYLLMPVRLS